MKLNLKCPSALMKRMRTPLHYALYFYTFQTKYRQLKTNAFRLAFTKGLSEEIYKAFQCTITNIEKVSN